MYNDNHEAEVRERLGKDVLKRMKADFVKGFRIVGQTEKTFIVGDSSQNIEYSRKTGRVMKRFEFNPSRSLKRK